MLFSTDANLFKTAFAEAQETNKPLLGQSSTAAPAPVAEDESATSAVPAAAADAEPTASASTDKPATATDEEAAPPTYKDEGKTAPPEKASGEETKSEVSSVFPSEGGFSLLMKRRVCRTRLKRLLPHLEYSRGSFRSHIFSTTPCFTLLSNLLVAVTCVKRTHTFRLLSWPAGRARVCVVHV